MTRELRISRNPEVVARDLRDEEGTLLLHRPTGSYHRLNRTGALIWRVLETPTSLEELESCIRSELREPPDTLRHDLASYVEDLAGRGLVLLGDLLQ